MHTCVLLIPYGELVLHFAMTLVMVYLGKLASSCMRHLVELAEIMVYLGKLASSCMRHLVELAETAVVLLPAVSACCNPKIIIAVSVVCCHGVGSLTQSL
jgi:hypothetical protein